MLRHPSLVKFQGIFTAADRRVVLVTEPVSPLLTIVDSMTVEEVTAGQAHLRLATLHAAHPAAQRTACCIQPIPHSHLHSVTHTHTYARTFMRC